MIYKDFKGLKLSALGMGCMRLPLTGEDRSAPVDEAAAIALIRRAYESGINYFDTAYGYVGGQSEIVTGKALSIYPRDSYYLATKLPGHMMNYKNGSYEFSGYMTGSPPMTIAEVFEKQLEKCGVDYFDFYLLHNVCETAMDFYTNKEVDVVGYLLKQKEAGRIKHLGFSAHGRVNNIAAFLDLYPNIFEFCQIQLNYLDWSLQEAGLKYQLLTERGLAVIVMEPVRGGRLADLGEELNAKFKTARPDESVASWAFRYIQGLDNVLVTLSGMSNNEQLDDNLKTYAAANPLNGVENDLLGEAVASMLDMVPCTACRYCTDGCPSKLDIPRLLAMYNEAKFGGAFTLSFTLGAMTEAEMPAACADCGACVTQCPQGIAIPELLKDFDEKLKVVRR